MRKARLARGYTLEELGLRMALSAALPHAPSRQHLHQYELPKGLSCARTPLGPLPEAIEKVLAVPMEYLRFGSARIGKNWRERPVCLWLDALPEPKRGETVKGYQARLAELGVAAGWEAPAASQRETRPKRRRRRKKTRRSKAKARDKAEPSPWWHG